MEPRIRASMSIGLRSNVIILDEAHNIEDSAREAASGSFTQENFRLVLNDCETVTQDCSSLVVSALGGRLIPMK